MQLLILGCALLVGFWLLSRWFVSANPRTVSRVIRIGGIVLLAVVALVLLITGRIGVALAALAFLFPMLMRARAMFRQVKSTFGPSPGKSSGLRTEFLDMNLDHDSGDLEGRVRRGRFAGRPLASLNQGELFDLLREMAGEDPSGLPVLEAYMDRLLGPDWRDDLAGEGVGDGASAEQAAEGGAMSESEALKVLDLEPGADEEAVKAAHRAKMKTHHPDHGGTAEAATRINRAKDLLLGNH